MLRFRQPCDASPETRQVAMNAKVGSIGAGICIIMGAAILGLFFVLSGPTRWVALLGVMPLATGLIRWRAALRPSSIWARQVH